MTQPLQKAQPREATYRVPVDKFPPRRINMTQKQRMTWAKHLLSDAERMLKSIGWPVRGTKKSLANKMPL